MNSAISSPVADHVFAPAPTVRHAEVDGMCVLLDLSSESYKVLDDRATAMWSVLIGQADKGTVFEQLIRRYDVDLDRLGADFTSFTRQCVETGLVDNACATSNVDLPPPARPAMWFRRGTPPIGRALSYLVATQRALRRDGFSKTYSRYANLPSNARSGELSAVVKAFAGAENLFVASRAPGDCLIRSLALFRLLRSEGLAAEHVIGVSRVPFEAHAWVEYAGRALLDDQVGRFTPLARIGTTVV